jgi:hypothetical protein
MCRIPFFFEGGHNSNPVVGSWRKPDRDDLYGTTRAAGSLTPAATIGIVRVSGRKATVAEVESARYCRVADNQLLRERSYPIDVTAVPPKVSKGGQHP